MILLKFPVKLISVLITIVVLLVWTVVQFVLETVFALIIMPLYLLSGNLQSGQWPETYPVTPFAARFRYILALLSWLFSW